ncbi:MAG: lipocalin-like domain-containing protein [Pseudomonadota bacterium]|nr:lipocalin-like domain-containing protein [Pseudomonadota bacterium]
MEKTFQPLTYDVKNPVIRSPMEEWAPHAKMSEKTLEWWYLTSLAYDEAGNPYFIFVILNNFTGEEYQKMNGASAPDGKRIVSIGGRIMDYNREKSYVPATSGGMMDDSEIWDAENNAAIFKTSTGTASWSYNDQNMQLEMETPNIKLSLRLGDADKVYWHQDKLGIEGMIQQGAEDDFSFYYSIPSATLNGTMSLTDEDGNTRHLVLSGSGWVDKQWGDFLTLSWEWSSFRFNNGARLHLYKFYNGHQEGLYVSADGEASYFDNVIVKQNGYTKNSNMGTWVSWGWSYEFPIEIEGSKHFTVKPYSDSDKEFLEYPQFNYSMFEGAGVLIDDEKGEKVGISVNESADVRVMDNAPYGKNQK